MTPFSGASSSWIRNTEAPMESAQIRNAPTTVPLYGALRPKLAKCGGAGFLDSGIS